jgi:hypothetical protein
MKFSASRCAPTATIVATTMLALSLNACGKTNSNGNASAMKSETSSKPDYQCVVESNLRQTPTSPEGHWREVFDLKAGDLAVNKTVGVTDGGHYLTSILRSTTDAGDHIHLYIHESKTKSTVRTKFPEGTDHLELVVQANENFEITLSCTKK